jgi:hypothetical protein
VEKGFVLYIPIMLILCGILSFGAQLYGQMEKKTASKPTIESLKQSDDNPQGFREPAEDLKMVFKTTEGDSAEKAPESNQKNSNDLERVSKKVDIEPVQTSEKRQSKLVIEPIVDDN